MGQTTQQKGDCKSRCPQNFPNQEQGGSNGAGEIESKHQEKRKKEKEHYLFLQSHFTQGTKVYQRKTD